ncbi:MAG: protein-export chaperone SecB [Gammaproteobacteria bacterium]
MTNEAQQENNKPEFSIQRIYIKDLSLESPASPQVFRQEWKPDINLQINVDSSSLEEDFHQVILKVTVTAKNQDKTALLIEVHQAGIFLLRNFSNEQRRHMLGAFCPNILFPYAREFISETAIRAGFPPLYLSPINFDAIYAEQSRQESATSETIPTNQTVQ